MNNQMQVYSVRLEGVRPLLFDRYAGDNQTKLSPENKFYLGQDQQLIIPALNIFSLLAAENTKSAAKMFFGKQWSKIAQGIKAHVDIDPYEIPILDENNQPIRFNGFTGGKVEVIHHVARLAKGVPNPKERPKLNLPWALEFNLSYLANKDATVANVRQAIEEGGSIGLGTFRPFFGTYRMTRFELTAGE